MAMPNHPRDGAVRMIECPTGKVGYSTRDDARAALARIRRSGNRLRRYYPCPLCGRWHLTKRGP